MWRQEATAGGVRLLLIAERLVACQIEIGCWGMNTVAGAPSVTSAADVEAASAEIVACARDIPVQQILELLTHQSDRRATPPPHPAGPSTFT